MMVLMLVSLPGLLVMFPDADPGCGVPWSCIRYGCGRGILESASHLAVKD
jgi:hypothetical protein